MPNLDNFSIIEDSRDNERNLENFKKLMLKEMEDQKVREIKIVYWCLILSFDFTFFIENKGNYQQSY